MRLSSSSFCSIPHTLCPSVLALLLVSGLVGADVVEIEYGYDDLNRLVSLDRDDGPSVEYSYDAVSNLVTDVISDSPDTDGDGEADFADVDDDNDGVDDGQDAFPLDPSESLDTDGDGIGNNADTDDDNDGLPDTWELAHGLDPLIDDTAADTDGDGFSNLQEYTHSSDPTDVFGIPNVFTAFDIDQDVTQHLFGWVVDTQSPELLLGGSWLFWRLETGLRASLDVNEKTGIYDAYIQFSASADGLSGAYWTIDIEDSADASGFSPAPFNVSWRWYRPETVIWHPTEWSKDDRTAAQRTPDISGLIESIVHKPEWWDGQHIVLRITGAGTRSVWSADAPDPATRPQLLVQTWEPAYRLDHDNDGIEDYKDEDDDNDGCSDAWEATHGHNWLDDSDAACEIEAETESTPDA